MILLEPAVRGVVPKKKRCDEATIFLFIEPGFLFARWGTAITLTFAKEITFDRWVSFILGYARLFQFIGPPQ
jgi:hypothetical protein